MRANWNVAAPDSILQQQRFAAFGADKGAKLQTEGPGGGLGAIHGQVYCALLAEAAVAVWGQGLDDQGEVLAVQARVGADGGAAGAFQGEQGAALGRHRQGGGQMAYSGQPGGVDILDPGLDGQGALSGGGRGCCSLEARLLQLLLQLLVGRVELLPGSRICRHDAAAAS